MLKIDHLTVQLGGRTILSDLSFSAGEGLTMLLGRNGSGKSTMLRAILGSCPHVSGTIEMNGCDVAKLSVRQRARLLAYVPQRQTIPPRMRVLDYVALGASPSFSLLTGVSTDMTQKAETILERLHLNELRDRYLDEVSGGEARLAALARARMQEDAILLLDEPLSGLDWARQHEFLSLLRREDASGLVTVHDPQLARQYADTILILHEGTLLHIPKGDDAAFADAMKLLYGENVVYVQTGALCLPVYKDKP